MHQILDEAGIEGAGQFPNGGETAANELVSRLADQRLHLGVPHAIVSALDEDEAFLALLRGTVELSFGRREPGLVLRPVVVAEEPDIDAATVHTLKIDGIGAAARCG